MQANIRTSVHEPEVDLPDQVTEFAHELARSHAAILPGEKNAALLKDLERWEKSLGKAYAYFRAEQPKDLNDSRAAEWILDNYYVARQAFRQVRQDLPLHFLRQLPKLEHASLRAFPRTFALAWELVSYSQARIDLAQMASFIKTYQQISPLSIGEVWALPIMLRIAILEKLSAAASALAGLNPPEGLLKIPASITPITQANDSVIANCFLTLQLFSATDWKIFFEQVSRVDQVLRMDPAGVYASMDFETRNQYRNVIEQLARHSHLDEESIARAAIELTSESQDSTRLRQKHVGFFLLDAGVKELEHRVGFKPALWSRFHRAALSHPTLIYLGSIFLFTIILLLAILAYTQAVGGSLMQLWIAGLLGIAWALDAAIIIVHWAVTHSVKPRSLPRMDFSEGIPEGLRTMVVVPTLLESQKDLDHLLLELELYYLANKDPQLTYALLTDFGDAPAQSMPGDEVLLSQARDRLATLNQKYQDTKPFFLFHRQREWNPSEGVWMGWERKRGKLAQFNRMLLEHGETSYVIHDGELSILPEVKYVITLDADTSLPQGSAARLVATLAHPLNQAEFGPDGRTVIAGYTVLQPRVAIKPTSASRSLFSRIFSGGGGFELYAFAVSDVYQDLFGEGSYVGKGIYDVAAFEHSLEGMVRENTLLSHDLFEGIYGRAALVTDVTLYEEYPSSYLLYERRLRRWIRGDWQLLPWLSPIVYTQQGLMPNRLSLISQWKIFDNLRRSLLPPALTTLFTAGWLLMAGSPVVWTILVMLPSLLPILLHGLAYAVRNIRRLTSRRLLAPLYLPLLRWALSMVFLPHETLLMIESILTTLRRLLIARRHLLQWTTAANAARLWGSTKRREIWMMMAAPAVLSLVLAALIIRFNIDALPAALPVLISWFVSPEIAYRISQPVRHAVSALNEGQRRQITRLSRRTWAFFERFTSPDDHWLPPDHFQSLPRGSVAHYTTPTNIGMFLVSALSAYDLGYIGMLELVFRLRSTFDSIAKLEHYRGHLLNWYDSQNRLPLAPRYVSTVDSGNLAACLLSLRQGCLSMQDKRLLDGRQWLGLEAVLDVLKEVIQSYTREHNTISLGPVDKRIEAIIKHIGGKSEDMRTWSATLEWLQGRMEEDVIPDLLNLLKDTTELEPESLGELRLFVNLMQYHLQDLQRNINLFAPWLRHLDHVPEKLLGSPAFQKMMASLPAHVPTLGEAAPVYDSLQSVVAELRNQVPDDSVRQWCEELERDLISARLAATPLLIGFQDIASQAEAMVNEMDFRFLFNDRRQVFHIGYNVNTQRLDPSFYDLLASEARIASLVAIAKGDVPTSHWQHLGRPVTSVNGNPVLLSWSGTMFEYLMPALFTRSYPDTFLTDSGRTALEAQIAYGQENHVPWGISESGYYAFDLNMNYQYRAFGVPSLGYKRDLLDDLVIAPYACILGLTIDPRAVVENMGQLAALGMLGRYGFYEAIDFSEARMPEGQGHAIVLSYMAHHQGMILTACANYLAGNQVVERFHADERIKTVELLLQEKVPENAPVEFPHPDESDEAPQREQSIDGSPWSVPVESQIPLVHVLSQGDTSLLISNSGGGYSHWKEFALTRWQADCSLDDWGTWIYIQDMENGNLWSATCQPRGCSLDTHEVMFYPHKAEFRSSEDGIAIRTEALVGSDGLEIRRVTLLNDSDKTRRLRLLSYGEVVLSRQVDDRRHPAFNKLFIESEYISRLNALLFHRRKRSDTEKSIFMAHALVLESGRKLNRGYETDRGRFLGRNGTARRPKALFSPVGSLSGTTGKTLDPIFSLYQEVELKPRSRARLTFLTAARSSRQEVLDLLSHHQSSDDIVRSMDLARARSGKEMVELGLNSDSVSNIQWILSALIYPVTNLRARPDILEKNIKGQPGLWAFGISGDFPILLVRLRDGESSLLVEALQAYLYWRHRHVVVNLVILNEQDTGYSLDLHNSMMRQIARMGLEARVNTREGIFILRHDQMDQSDLILLESMAGVVLDEKDGDLAEHAGRLMYRMNYLPAFNPSLSPSQDSEATPALEQSDDLPTQSFPGRFSRDGTEYILRLKPGESTPRPWSNVIANSQFGFLVTESGGGCTWALNSGENRLTPWRNDPLTDMPGEAIYLRDEETAQFWSVTPMPAGADTVHVVRHGAGYTTFESQSHGLNQKLRLFAAPDDPVKIAHLRLENLWDRPRRITATYYAEWVLGTTRQVNQAHIVPEFDTAIQSLLARNQFNIDFATRVAFLAASKQPHGVTADRTEFLGKAGSMRRPAALGRIGLAGTIQAGRDSCAAFQVHVDLGPGEVEEFHFILGQGADRAQSLDLIQKYQAAEEVQRSWKALQAYWDQVLGTIQVETPDPNMDILLNRWMLYQALSCRLLGRTALYQSSGAFGFRDQLQDVLALLHTKPEIAREQILRCAAHQFEEGDVLHWWHPPANRGVRTRFSDDLLWLPYVTAEYVFTTGDRSILEEKLPFLHAESLKPGEDERYGEYAFAGETFDVFEHCRRAIEKGTSRGAHGLPLIGSGDWNDGMNRVGIHGRGESVWMGWFLCTVLNRFADLCRLVGNDPEQYRSESDRLAASLEDQAWDGAWYLRGFYDDGSSLGSSQNDECKIDSIAQSWAVISGMAQPDRAAQAMESVNQFLVRQPEQLILLFSPPFDKTSHDPGYIKGYPPGVRENGGQYTHASIWSVWAFAKLGLGERAHALFKTLNPINHADTPEKCMVYGVEPYVVAADIYSVAPHIGRGGWTWYTGSAAWLYRLGMEAILGFSRTGEALKIDPCIPAYWPAYKIRYRYGKTTYEITVDNSEHVNRGVKEITLDGKTRAGNIIPLQDDGLQHDVLINMGRL